MRHPTETPEYWEALARSERSAASADRLSRHGTVESIRVHLKNAAEYESAARRLRDGLPLYEEERS